MTKISIIGAGKLGSKIAYTLAQRKISDEIAIVDIMKDVALGNAIDISQSIAYSNNTKIISNGYEDISDSDIVIITAGKPRTPDMNDRLELAKINANIVSSVCEQILKHAPNSIVITCSNPMDLMNHIAFKKLGFEQQRVIGFGGRLDGSRLKYIIANHINVKTSDINCDVIGEHGQSMTPVFSRLTVNGEKQEFSNTEKEKITAELRGIALKIISLKGITDFAPASGVADMADAILNDTNLVVPCSMNLEGENISIGVPVKLNRNGANILEWKLTDEETKMFNEGKNKLKDLVSSL